MATIVTINASDQITSSRADLNTNFTNLNADKIETSVLDTDTALTANSDAKVATQKAVKAYVDAGGNVNASDTVRGIVEEATDAEVLAGTTVGGTGARLFVNPGSVSTILNSLGSTNVSAVAGEALTAGDAVAVSSGVSTYTWATTGSTNASAGANYSAQTFQLGIDGKINEIALTVNFTAGGTTPITVGIYDVVAGEPSGSAIQTGTITDLGASGSCTFGSPVLLTAGTQYAIVMHYTAGTADMFRYYTSGSYANGQMMTSSDGTGWTQEPGKDIAITFVTTIGETSKVYKTDSDINGSSPTDLTNNFIGFVTNATDKGDTAVIRCAGVMEDVSTGMVPGGTVYISNTAGDVSQSAGSVSRKIGMAVSSNDVIIKNDHV